MTQYLPIIVASGLVAFLVTPLSGYLARRLGMVDQPGLRKAHRLPVPLLGGAAIYLALTLGFVAFGSRAWVLEGAGILGGATVLFFTGLWDDRYGLPARFKLAVQVLVAVYLIAVGIQVRLLDRWWFDWPITILWVVGITNAANLMDNMDGLAAGMSGVAAVFFFVLAALEGQGLVASLAAALIGAAVGFLFYNFAPAASFMGDAGSLMLGFLLAVLGIKLRFVSFPLGATWMVPIVVLGLPIFDTALVTLSRWRRKRPIFLGGSDHTSHRLVQLGLSQPRAVLTLYVVAAALGAAGIFLTRAPVATANVVFACLVALGLAGLIALERVEPRLTGDPPLVLIPGGGGFVAALQAAAGLSQDVTVLLAPRRVGAQVLPARSEVVEALALLGEDPAAVRDVLSRALDEAWWLDVPRLSGALRLRGTPLVVYDTPLEALPVPGQDHVGVPSSEALAALGRARLVVLGPGDPEANAIPALAAVGVRRALSAGRGQPIWIGSESQLPVLAAWVGHPVTLAQPGHTRDDLQARLLQQASAGAKTGG